jgi:putative membrane protein
MYYLIAETVIILILATILPGVYVQSIVYALGTAVVLALLNIIVKPVIIFLTLPLTFITMGLFLLVINTVIILLASHLLSPGFHVSGFFSALLFGIVLSIINELIL